MIAENLCAPPQPHVPDGWLHYHSQGGHIVTCESCFHVHRHPGGLVCARRPPTATGRRPVVRPDGRCGQWVIHPAIWWNIGCRGCTFRKLRRNGSSTCILTGKSWTGEPGGSERCTSCYPASGWPHVLMVAGIISGEEALRRDIVAGRRNADGTLKAVYADEKRRHFEDEREDVPCS